MRTIDASAKINLSLVVGPRRVDGKHEVATVLQRVALADAVTLEEADRLEVLGFAEDTIVAAALTALSQTARVPPRWRVTITKGIPVAAGLGGGSSDAAAALLLANDSLVEPLDQASLHVLAATIGADVPFFLRTGAQLGTGDGSTLAALELPTDYTLVLVLPEGAQKESTAAIYAAFDARGGEAGFRGRRSALATALASVRGVADLAALPGNDLARSPVAEQLLAAGAVRADVSGAGPCVYGIFIDPVGAAEAARALASSGRTWVTTPI